MRLKPRAIIALLCCLALALVGFAWFANQSTGDDQDSRKVVTQFVEDAYSFTWEQLDPNAFLETTVAITTVDFKKLFAAQAIDLDDPAWVEIQNQKQQTRAEVVSISPLSTKPFNDSERWYSVKIRFITQNGDGPEESQIPTPNTQIQVIKVGGQWLINDAVG